MRLLGLELRDFQSHNNTVLDFSDIPAAIITGINGAGKSSLVEGLSWIAWNVVRYDFDKIVRIGQMESAGSLTFSQNGATYRIARTRSIRGRGASTLNLDIQDANTDSGWRSLNGAGIRDTQAKINDLIGAYDLASATWLSPQGEADKLAKAAPAERRTILGRLLGLDKWATLKAAARATARDIETKVEVVSARRGDYEALSALFTLRQISQEEKAAVVQNLKADLATAESEIQSLRDRHAAALAEATKIREIRTRADGKAAELDRIHAEILYMTSVIEAAKTQIASLEKQAGWGVEVDERLAEARQVVENLSKNLDDIMLRGEIAAEAVREAEKVVEAAQRAIDSKQAAVREEWQNRRTEALEQRQQRAQELQVATDALRSIQDKIEKATSEHNQQWLDLRAKASMREAENKTSLQISEAGLQHVEQRLQSLRQDAGDLDTVPCGGSGEFSGCRFLTRAVASKNQITTTEKDLDEIRRKTDEARKAHEQSVKDLADLGTEPPFFAPEMELVRALEDTKATVETARSAHDGAVANLNAIGIDPPNAVTIDEDEALRVASTKLQEAQAIKAKLGNEWRQVKSDRETAIQSRDYIESRKAAAESNIQALADARAALQSRNAELETSTRRRNELSEEYESLKAQGQPERALGAEAEQRKVQMAEADDKRDSMLRAVAEAESYQREAARLVQESQGAHIKVKEIDRATASDRKKVADLLTLTQAYADVPQLVIETVIPDIERQANELLKRVSQTGLSVSLHTQKALKSDKDKIAETLDILVQDNSGERPYETYSGGERFRLDWALRVALAHVLSARAGLPLETLWIDEGFGSLDAAGKAAFGDTLAATADMFGLCLVISHVPELAESFPIRLNLVKGPNGSVATWV